jgi:phospho-N-acetylmuramoyl-pentapeptide-transferase
MAISLLLGLLIFSFTVTSILIIPFINLLYRFRMQRQLQQTKDVFNKPTPIFDRFHKGKVGIPIGGGWLIVIVVLTLFMFLFPLLQRLGIFITANFPIKEEVHIIFFSFISFALLGLYDDVMKFFKVEKTGFFGLRIRHKLLIQLGLALIISLLIYVNLKISFFYIPFIGIFNIGWFFVPLSTFIIVFFANAVNITDGLDGLAGGVLLICLFAFWFLSASILDTPVSFFIALWIGALISFLYFNIFPARIMMGDVGSLAFGATLATIGILLGKTMALLIIGGVFVIEIVSSFLQIVGKKIYRKKIFPVAPFHLWLQLIGWPEPKIVFRAWLASLLLAIFGLWLALV